MEDLSEILRIGIRASISAKQQMLDGSRIVDSLAKVVNKVVDVYGKDGKVLFCGNGVSAADAQHLAAEFVSKLARDRDPLPALALTVDSSMITAIGNDYGYENVFSRELEAVGKSEDILFLKLALLFSKKDITPSLASSDAPLELIRLLSII